MKSSFSNIPVLGYKHYGVKRPCRIFSINTEEDIPLVGEAVCHEDYQKKLYKISGGLSKDWPIDYLGHESLAPHEYCSCGFYAWDSPNYGQISGSSLIFQVELYGRVIKHTHGYRAQFQRLLAYKVNDRDLAKNYILEQLPIPQVTDF